MKPSSATNVLDISVFIVLGLFATLWSIRPSTQFDIKTPTWRKKPVFQWSGSISEPSATLIMPFGLPSKVGFTPSEELPVNLQELVQTPEISPHFLEADNFLFLSLPLNNPQGENKRFQSRSVISKTILPAFRLSKTPPGHPAHLLLEADPPLASLAFGIENIGDDDLKQFDKSFSSVMFVEMTEEGRPVNVWVETSSGDHEIDLKVTRLLMRSKMKKNAQSVLGHVMVSFSLQ